MKKLNIGIFLSLLLMVGLCSCGEQKSNTKLVLNEVLIENESNFQDDYGVHSAWIEIFNRSFGSADLAGCLLKVSSQPGDTATYFIPKGDVLTLVKPRQHALFWADGEPNRGTFHTNFTLNAATDNWIGLYDSGKKLLVQWERYLLHLYSQFIFCCRKRNWEDRRKKYYLRLSGRGEQKLYWKCWL